jgi:nickel-dependent lactate racemase
MHVPERLMRNPDGGVHSVGSAQGFLDPATIEDFIAEELARIDVDGKRVCLIVPDDTRSCPMPQLLPLVYRALAPRASELTALVALGTHAAMDEAGINAFFAAGQDVGSLYPKMRFVNHEWWKPETFSHLGTVTTSQIKEISEGRLETPVDVRINRIANEADVSIVLGPVFPHEVVGFSGGAKYFMPGIAGKEIINTSHWLGALISSATIIGTPGITPVRALINEAVGRVECEVYALCLVVQSGPGNLHAMSFGAAHPAWEAAAAISSGTHITYLDRPVKQVLSIIPSRYHDIWTAAKGMYKVEPAIADGGEVIIYAPHVTEFAQSHPELAEIGYHCMPYFTEQWEKFKDFPGGLLAHSTHLRGQGTYSEAEGERCRITVTLATGISEAETWAMNLNYRDPASIDIDAFPKDDPDYLFVPHAGEMLFRLR